MALPVLKSLSDCANWTETVQPYIYQVRPLPKVVLEFATNPTALKQLYLSTNPLIIAFVLSLALAPIFLVVSEINKNYSQVDRFWSILPTVYNLHYAIWAHSSGFNTERLDLVAAVSTIWSLRLTFNYWRRGGYQIGSEDYRWMKVKEYVGQPWFFLFNIIFIAYIQMILLFSVTTPTYILLLTSRLATVQNQAALDKGDIIAALAMLSFILLSATADQQQWNYHSAKNKFKETGKVPEGWDRDELERGFCSSGLFAVSRHPNFAAEQAVWVSLHIWASYISGAPFNWTGIGAVCYLCLFQGSTWLTELLSARKYPAYKEYQRQVGMFFPENRAHPPVFSKPGQAITDVDKNADAAKARERYNLR